MDTCLRNDCLAREIRGQARIDEEVAARQRPDDTGLRVCLPWRDRGDQRTGGPAQLRRGAPQLGRGNITLLCGMVGDFRSQRCR